MAQMIEIDFQPDRSTLRQFGWIALGGFSLLAGLAWMEWAVFAFGLGEARAPVALGLLAVGGVAAFFSLVAPKANLPLFVGLSILAFPIGFVLSYLILGFLFYGVITPIGLAMRLFGRDPLLRSFDSDQASYWSEPRPPRGKESYFKQF